MKNRIAFGSVCSGIEAASVAWEPLGFKAAWLSEIEPFPCALLAHHWPDTPNLGDMTAIASRIRAGEVTAPEMLVGGTPCQAFSVAGLRAGLSDERGALTISFVELANEIDRQRTAVGLVPAVITWENVPGVLTSKDNAFGCFLAGLAGEDCELVPPGRKWTDAGCVFGPQRAIAWRILDAQYFGVAQRRRRVFVVASARDGFDPAAVLFEFDGLRRDSAPSRGPGEEVAGTLASRTSGGGFPGTDEACSGYLRPGHIGNTGCWLDGGQISQTLDAVLHKGQTMPEKNRFPAVLQPIVTVHGTQDPDVNTELAHTLGRNQGQENAVCVTGTVTHTLKAEGFDGSEDGTGRGQPIVPAGLAVRRITPTEAERLQGFPDGHTAVPYRGKPAADGPRYKAIGNSMAVPVMRWIGERIKAQIVAMAADREVAA